MTGQTERLREVLDDIEETLDRQEFAVKFLLKQHFRRMLFRFVTNPDAIAQKIDKVIDIIMDEACYTNRGDGEDYPIIGRHEDALLDIEEDLLLGLVDNIRIPYDYLHGAMGNYSDICRCEKCERFTKKIPQKGQPYCELCGEKGSD